MKYLLVYENIVRKIAREPSEVYKTFTWHEVEDDVLVSAGDRYENGIITPFSSKVKADDDFRKAVKYVIKAIAQYINGTLTKAELLALYQEHKDIIETIT